MGRRRVGRRRVAVAGIAGHMGTGPRQSPTMASGRAVSAGAIRTASCVDAPRLRSRTPDTPGFPREADTRGDAAVVDDSG